MKTGIIGYGVYIPKYRIKAEEIANAWNQNIQKIILNAVHYVKEVSKNIWEDNHSPTPTSNRPNPIENISKKGFSVGHPTKK